MDDNRGNVVERWAWVLLALISAVMILFGFMMFFTRPPLEEPISGSLCCNGQRLADLPSWGVDYLNEMAKYMGTFTILAGLLAMLVIVVPYRRRERWAWYALWVLPLLFLVHGAVLGSFPFDYGPLTLTTLGLLLPARQFFSDRAATPALKAKPAG